MKIAECVDKSRIKQLAERRAFLIRETWASGKILKVLGVNLAMHHVEVSAYNHRFYGVQSADIFAKLLVPAHPEGEAPQLRLRVGRIYAYKVKPIRFQCYDTAFVIQLLHTDAVADRQWLGFGIDGRPGIPFLIREVPI